MPDDETEDPRIVRARVVAGDAADVLSDAEDEVDEAHLADARLVRDAREMLEDLARRLDD